MDTRDLDEILDRFEVQSVVRDEGSDRDRVRS